MSARIAAAQATYEATRAQFEAGVVPLEEGYTWSMRWYQSEREAGRPTAASAHAARMEALAAQVRTRIQQGISSSRDGLAVDYYLAEAAVLRGR